MHKPTLTAHCLIRNEERWVWYVVNSIINFVDRVLVFDTGSTDNTVKIINSIKSPKIVFEQKGSVNKTTYVNLRQEMVDRTRTDWFLILDGDEIWPKNAITELKKAIQKAPQNKETVIVGEWACIGDIFHYSKGLVDFRIPRAIKKIPGLHAIGEYGYESYADANEINIDDWTDVRRIYLNQKFFHMTFLPRSSSHQKDREVMMRAPKTFYYKGAPFPKNFPYPEVLYKDKPEIVQSPWIKFTSVDYFKGWFYRTENFLNRLLSKP